jgi:hypothetical protein
MKSTIFENRTESTYLVQNQRLQVASNEAEDEMHLPVKRENT